MRNQRLMKFSAHIAHLLDRPDEDGWVRVDPSALILHLQDLLGRGLAGAYRIEIVGAHLMGLNATPEDVEEGSQRWIDGVFDRPLQIRAGRSLHLAHQMLESFVRRAPGVESTAWLREPPMADGSPLCEDLRRTAVRLEDLARKEAKTAKAKAPLWLQAGRSLLRVPASLSVWGAISAAPNRMRPLESLEAQDEAVYAMIRALETANVAWGRAVVLRIPPDKHGLSTNQIKSLQAFVKRAGSFLYPRPPRETLEAAWAQAPVTRFASLDAFLSSPACVELFSPTPEPGFQPLDEAEAEAEAEAEPFFRQDRLPRGIDPETRRLHAEALAQQEHLEEREKRLALAVLLDRRSLREIWGELWARQAFRSFDELRKHTDILVEKLHQSRPLLSGEGSEDS